MQNGLTFTNNKTNDSSAIIDSSNPLRLYKNSTVTIECLGMTKIVITCNTNAYATSLGTSIGSAASVNNKVVTIVFDKAIDTFEITLSDGQVRVDSITVTAGEDCEHTNRDEADCITPETCTKCGATFGNANGHTAGEIVVENTNAANCENAGSYDNAVYCTVCGDEISRETITVDAIGHTEGDWIVDAEATEGVDGSQHKECTTCGKTLITEVIPALSHVCKYTTVVVTDPTCTEAGYTTYKCGCGESYTEAGEPATGHTEVVDDAVAPTCTTAGKTEGKHCSVCSTVLVAQTTVTATGHAWSSWTSNGNNTHSRTCANNNAHTETANCSGGTATCQEKATCGACGQQYGDLGSHTTNQGTCDDCEQEIVPVWTLVTDVSQLQAGDQIIIVAKEYDFALSTTQNSNNRGQIAITKNGNTIKIDENVQILILQEGTKTGTFAFYTGSGYLYAASSGSNHLKTQTTNTDDGSWKISIASGGVATIVAQGTYTRNTLQYNQTSSLFSCYASASQQAIVIYKISGGEVACKHTNATTTTVDATCTKAGSTTVTCKDCGETTVTEIPALGHTTDNGVCDNCGEEIGGSALTEKTYNYTFTGKVFTDNQTKTLNGVDWTLAGDGGYWDTYDSTKGQQLGSSKKPYKNMTLTSTTEFSNVSKIVINTSGGSSVSAKLVVKVGNTEVKTITLSANATEYTIDIAGLTGPITFSYTQTSSKALYIKSISVTYAE